MTYVLVPLILVLVAMTVITLVRGVAAFLQSTREDMDRPDGAGPSAMQLKQNQLMFRRIIYQAAAVFVVAILLFASR